MRDHAKVIVALGAILVLGWTGPGPAVAEDDELAKRVDRSVEVFQELGKVPDRAIPEALLEDCKCIAIFPHVIKGALVFGARRGKGIVSCRDTAGAWSPPVFLTMTGGSWGLQIGAEASDVVLVFMTRRGAQSLLESKFTLGGTVGVAAGPVGRKAEAGTDLKLNAEIYSYARTKGLFAGISLEGARLAPDAKSTATYYGAPVEAKTVLFEHRVPRRPPGTTRLLGALPPGR